MKKSAKKSTLKKRGKKMTTPKPNPKPPQTEYLKIDPLEQVIKAIGIVHGPDAEKRLRYVLFRMEQENRKAMESAPWTRARMQRLLDENVSYKNWHFIVDERTIHFQFSPDAPESEVADLRLRAEWLGPDAETGKMENQQSRWWPLSEHMCKTEIIQTAFLCVLKAEEHEIRETFRYKGKAPFHTHIDIETLAAASGHVDVRTDTRPRPANVPPPKQRRE
jgi:hypothetical protein